MRAKDAEPEPVMLLGQGHEKDVPFAHAGRAVCTERPRLIKDDLLDVIHGLRHVEKVDGVAVPHVPEPHSCRCQQAFEEKIERVAAAAQSREGGRGGSEIQIGLERMICRSPEAHR